MPPDYPLGEHDFKVLFCRLIPSGWNRLAQNLLAILPTCPGAGLRPRKLDLAVWEALRDIPFGYTTAYGAISKFVGPGAPAQAVGQAVGRNHLAIFIPAP